MGCVAIACLYLTFSAVSESDRPAKGGAAEVTTSEFVPGDVLNQHLYDYTLLDLNLPDTAAAPFDIPVMLGDDTYTLALEPYSVRSDSFRVMVPDDAGNLVETPAPAPATMRGFVIERPDSRVAASLSHDGLTAIIDLGDGAAAWYVQPMSAVSPDAPGGMHFSYSALDAIEKDVSCGNDFTPGDHPDHLEDQPGPESPSIPGATLPHDPADHLDGFDPGPEDGDNKTTDIAIDADFEYFQRNGGSVPATVADIESIINSVEVIYQRDVSICWNITLIIVRDAEPDPYTSTNFSTLLNQFINHWNSQQTGNRTDTMHLFTGKNLNGGVIGVANCIGCICSLSASYALSEARFTGIFSWRVGLVAHEIGHVYGAFHCCNGCSGCSTCHIMCPCIAGCSGDVTRFGPQSINSITNHRNSRSCLDDGCGDSPETFGPEAFSVGVGDLVSGGLAELQNSDNQRLVVQQSFPVTPLFPNVRVDVQGNGSLTNPSRVEFVLEARATAVPATAPQRISLWNFNLSGYEQLDQRTATSSDSVVTLSITNNPERYVSGSGTVLGRLEWFDPGQVVFTAWNAEIDQVEWTLEP